MPSIAPLLLVGQIVVVAMLYVFVWRSISSARRDLARSGGVGAGVGRRSRSGAPPIAAQESTIMPIADVARAGRAAGLTSPRLVVVTSDVLREGVPYTVAGGLTLGRSADNDIVLDDSTVSSQHARLVPPHTFVDDGSTNGSFVNGVAVRGRQQLTFGDTVQVGSTVFRFEEGR